MSETDALGPQKRPYTKEFSLNVLAAVADGLMHLEANSDLAKGVHEALASRAPAPAVGEVEDARAKLKRVSDEIDLEEMEQIYALLNLAGCDSPVDAVRDLQGEAARLREALRKAKTWIGSMLGRVSSAEATEIHETIEEIDAALSPATAPAQAGWETKPELEYDDSGVGTITLTWPTGEWLTIMDGALIGGRSPAVNGAPWKIELPGGFVRVGDTASTRTTPSSTPGSGEDGDGWQPIKTAPKDGSVVRVRRIFNGRKIFEGDATWRTVYFPSYDDDAPAFDATGWMYPDKQKRVPEPTHWLAAAPKAQT